MKYIYATLFFAIFISFFTLKKEIKICDENNEEYLITDTSVGFAYIGQTFSELKKKYKNYKFTPDHWDYGGGNSNNIGYTVSKNNIDYLFVSNMYGPIKADTINCIMALNEKYSTSQNISPGITIKKLLLLYPNTKIRKSTVYCCLEQFRPTNSSIFYEFVTDNDEKGLVGKNYKVTSYGIEGDLIDSARLITRIVVVPKAASY